MENIANCTFYNERLRAGGGAVKGKRQIEMCGNDNYCEIMCQLFRASLLLMDFAAMCCKTKFVLIRM